MVVVQLFYLPTRWETTLADMYYNSEWSTTSGNHEIERAVETSVLMPPVYLDDSTPPELAKERSWGGRDA